LGALGVAYGDRVAERVRFSWLMALAGVTAFLWGCSLALVDGSDGLRARIDSAQLLYAARHVSDLSATLHGFVGRIPLGNGSWNDHVAGHPAGALLFFWTLVRAHLGTGVLPGLVIAALFASVPVAVMTTLATLASTTAARSAAPYLVFCPAFIWAVISADAVYAAFSAWSLAALAHAAARRSIALGALAGIGLGATVMLSYGLVLMAIPAVVILMVLRSWRAAVSAAGGVAAVLVGFALAGFGWWAGFQAVHDRYWAGIARLRPASYWLWGDLAALCFSAGPALGALVACWTVRLRGSLLDRTRGDDDRPVLVLGGAALLAVTLADLSLMSKAEVERIWLPFTVWLVASAAFLPPRSHRWWLALNVIGALAINHLILTNW
jgi:hypothetical protein